MSDHGWYNYLVLREVIAGLVAMTTLILNRSKRTLEERLVDSNQSIAVNRTYNDN